MDYADQVAAKQYAPSAGSGTLTKVQKPASLTDIAEYAERIERAAAIVREFNDRFRPMPQLACADEAKAPPLDGYAGDIARLNREVSSLENAVAQLQNIG